MSKVGSVLECVAKGLVWNYGVSHAEIDAAGYRREWNGRIRQYFAPRLPDGLNYIHHNTIRHARQSHPSPKQS